MIEKLCFVANSDDEDEPNERPMGSGGVKRPRNNNHFDQSNKRSREETNV